MFLRVWVLRFVIESMNTVSRRLEEDYDFVLHVFVKKISIMRLTKYQDVEIGRDDSCFLSQSTRREFSNGKQKVGRVAEVDRSSTTTAPSKYTISSSLSSL